MLVAAVAGQSFDFYNKFGQDKSLLMKKLMNDELMYKKLGYPMVDKSLMYGQKDLVNLPFYLQDEMMDKKIFTIDELYTTELFKEYMTLPLFREYITVPMFQKFVQSIYFQKFWTVPAFKQYFVSPVLFYKYVYPMVQLFKYETTTTTLEQQILNKNVLPFVSGYEQDFVPTVYNKDFLLQDGHFYKNLLSKIYSQLYNIDETTNYNKIVDPITGEIKMIPFQGVDTIFGDKLSKDILLKKFLINKKIDLDTIFGDKLIAEILLKKNIDTELLKKIILSKNMDLDTSIFGDKLIKEVLLNKNVDVELLKDLLVKKEFDAELIKMLLINKMIHGDEKMIPEMMMNKMNPMVGRMSFGYNKGFPFFNKFDTVEKMNLFDILGKKDLINNKFENIDIVDKMDVFDILSKKDLLIKDKIMLNKILADKVNVSSI